MTAADMDALHRTVKLEIDSGRAASVEEAEAIVRRYRLQVEVGPGIERSLSRQAALLTAVNAARRAFIGGVSVRTHDNPVLTARWAQGIRLRDAVTMLGGTLVDTVSAAMPVIVIGDAPPFESDLLLHPTFDGWCGAVVRHHADRLPERVDFSLAGVLAGALAVSEAFQAVRGDVLAGHRDLGISLWRPGVDWRSTEAAGEAVRILPSRYWLLGLGHLGQAVAWTIGLLPFSDPGDVLVFLQDLDHIVKANEATGLLVPVDRRQILKTRLVSSRLETLGFRTRMSERAFTETTRRTPDEPGLAIAGFDKPDPRRALESAGFEYVVDLGLGGGPAHYLDIAMHSFPSDLSSAQCFRSASEPRFDEMLSLPAYRDWQKRLAAEDAGPAEQIRCGLLEIAGRSAGAAFVGAVAATIGLAEAIRALTDGPRYEVVDLTLRSPQHIEAAPNTNPGPPRNPGYTAIDERGA